MIEKFFKTALRESGLFEGVQIHSIVMPQGYNYPAIIFNRISANDEGSKNIKVGHLTSERWSFGIYTKTISLLKQLESSVKLTFDQTSNESFNIQSIYFADTSSDFYDEEFEVYSVNVDFYVRRIIDSEAGDLSTIVNPALTIFSKTYLITGTGVYNALLPLSGWVQPAGYDGNCAIVQFTDGITVFYTYNNGWIYDFKIGTAGEVETLPENITVLKVDDYIYLRTAFSSTQDIVQKLFIGESDLAFSPQYTTFLISNTVADTAFIYESGTLIHIAPDDAAPVFLNSSYIGAAHGYISMIALVSNGHGKTVQDVGSQWTDTLNRKFTIVKIINENTLWILGNDAWELAQYPKFYIHYFVTGNLTHFLGATHTDNIVLGSQSNAQMIPAIKDKALTIKLNGETTLTENGLYTANTVVIEEYYEAVNPVSAGLYLQSQVGSSLQPAINTGDTMFIQENKYTYYDNASCLVYNKFTPKQTMDFGYYGFTQSDGLYSSGLLTKLKQYIPKTLPITLDSTEYDFRTIEDIDTIPATASFSSTYWENADSPPERFIQYLAYEDGSLQVGRSAGFLKGKGVETTLKDSATTPIVLNTSSKIYFHGIDGESNMEVDNVYEGYCFRNYFAVNELAIGRIGEAYIKDGEDTYLYLDWNMALNDAIEMPDDLVGKTITILEKSDNVVLKNTIVPSVLLPVIKTATPQNGFAILKIT